MGMEFHICHSKRRHRHSERRASPIDRHASTVARRRATRDIYKGNLRRLEWQIWNSIPII